MKNHSKKPTNRPEGHVGGKAQEPPKHRDPTDDQIRARAHEIYLRRGGGQGHDLEDWTTAERELRKP